MASLEKRLAKEYCERARTAKLVFIADPIEAGMGGCPWRILVASIAAPNTRQKFLPIIVSDVLERYPSPLAMSEANYLDLTNLLQLAPLAHRKQRTLREMSKRWLGEDWDSILDLPGITHRGISAIDLYAGRFDLDGSVKKQETY